MSTSYMLDVEFQRLCKDYGLRAIPVPDSERQEFRIVSRWKDQPQMRDVLFQGTDDRCSDFLKGYIAGRSGKGAPDA